jgi:hypothetical protein
MRRAPVSIGPQHLKALAATDEPMDAIGFQLDNHILANAYSFIVGLLLMAVEVARSSRMIDWNARLRQPSRARL